MDVEAKSRLLNPLTPASTPRVVLSSSVSTISPPIPGWKHRKPFRKKQFRSRPRFKEAHLFPLYSKNPHIICRELQKLAREGKLKEAMVVLHYLDMQGIPVNATTLSALLSACAASKSLEEGRQVHVHVRINGLMNNEFICMKLVNMYAACGCLDEAKRVFDEMPSSSVYPWNALLRGTVINGERSNQGFLVIYTRMRELGVDMNEYTFSCLIKKLAGCPALREGMKAHALLVKNGWLVFSDLLMTSLIDLYFKCGKVKLAQRLFDEVVGRDVVLWGAMIAGFAHNRLRWEALEYTRWMRSVGIEPNSVILTIILPVIGEVNALNLGKEVHAFIIKRGKYMVEQFIQSSLVDMYCKCNDLTSGRRVFYGSTARNKILWTALMSGYVSNGRPEQAVRCIIWMQNEGIKPDVVSVATILPVCGELKALKQGKSIHGYAIKGWFLPNVSISTSLMIMYSKCGRLDCSYKVFDSTERRNVICWTAMIDSYLKHGCLSEALRIFRRMQLSKHRPDSISMSRILAACSDLFALKLGKELHCQLLKRDIIQVPYVSSALIKFYGMCSEVQKAHMVFTEVSVKGSMTWTAIIEAYGCKSLYKDALIMFIKMRSKGIEPTHFTFSVLLSICSKAGFADDALEIFDFMTRKHNLKASEEQCSCMIDLLIRSGRPEAAGHFMRMKSALIGMTTT